MGLRNTLRSFKRKIDGNVSIMFAVSFTMSFILIGAVFDLTLIHKGQSKLQNLSDAAALAALQFDGSVEEKEAVFAEYVNSLAGISGDKPNIVTTRVKVEETESLITINAEVKMPFELMMLQNFHNFDNVSVATEAQMGIENIEIALVIDISSSMRGARLTEAKKSSLFFIDQVLNDQSLNGRVAISFIPFGGTVRVPEEMKYLLETPDEGLAEYSKYWIDGKWNQCFEFDTDDIKNGLKSEATYRASPDFWSWNQGNPWCPLAGNEFLPLTDDASVLNAKVDMLSLSDGTGSDHGMLWGYESLNEDWKNKLPGGLEDTPAENKSSTKKVLVFMTDGGITSQHYVRDQYKTGLPPFNSRRKTRVSYNNSLSTFLNLCEKAKDKEIEIFTIGYNIKRTKHLTPLQTCASSETNFIDASTGNLEAVFGGIAAAISPLRVSN